MAARAAYGRGFRRGGDGGEGGADAVVEILRWAAGYSRGEARGFRRGGDGGEDGADAVVIQIQRRDFRNRIRTAVIVREVAAA